MRGHFTYNSVITGPDAESVPIQVLVHSCDVPSGEHSNGCYRGGNEQRKGNLAAEMEHELAHDSLLGNTQHCCKVCDDFMGRHTARSHLYPSMFCAVSVLFTTVLDSLLLGHDLSVGRPVYGKSERPPHQHEASDNVGDETCNAVTRTSSDSSWAFQTAAATSSGDGKTRWQRAQQSAVLAHWRSTASGHACAGPGRSHTQRLADASRAWWGSWFSGSNQATGAALSSAPPPAVERLVLRRLSIAAQLPSLPHLRP
ncbi:hypothetical protein PR202_gb07840 [Eleusine coracana subsp. coracana]|uniref:Uncharacterized protein n=1 Tax=Eleusine coracana subsp. coracana TaxID=191504 RepID=A0AAV5EAS1_ELECO|nr:hypothetical protein PR202_gb07840 [Eleusine coracana subsp. coracana]